MMQPLRMISHNILLESEFTIYAYPFSFSSVSFFMEDMLSVIRLLANYPVEKRGA